MAATEPSPRRRWRGPRTLVGRLVLVLVGGMLAAQLLTGTIWFDVRYDQVNEVPARVAGVEIGRWLASVEDASRDGDASSVIRPGFDVHRIATPASSRQVFRDATIEALLADAVAVQLGGPRTLHLRQVTLYDDRGRAATGAAVFGARTPEARYLLQVADARGQWWAVSIRSGQAGMRLQSTRATFEYVLRIYGLRMGLILLLSLLVVHWLVRPLRQLADAAQALGRDVNSPPLDTAGPREVQRAAEAFNRMQGALRAAFAHREQLLAAVSHDLRSPLTRLRLRTERIEDADLRRRFQADVAQMQAITDSILDYFQGRAGAPALEPMDLDALMGAIAADLAETGADVRIAGRIGVSVPAWPASLRRAMTNLVENAVRYGLRARVGLSRCADHVRIDIDDDGPGIPDDALARVREPFVRLDAARAGRGIGMGLSIADAVLQAHGGALRLENRIDPDGRIEGLRVRVELPMTAGRTHRKPQDG
ncbi:MAG: ATP-binding protein [Luteimonas sp.]